MPPDPDTRIRLAAFAHVEKLERESGGVLAGSKLYQGFEFEGERISLTSPRGSFKPRQMTHLLSIITRIPKRGRKVWYDEQLQVHRQLSSASERIDYSFQGSDPNSPDNQRVREACELRLPVLYFLGISPGRYMAHLVYLEDWDPGALKVRIVFARPDRIGEIQDHLDAAMPADTPERSYAVRGCWQRVHQPMFRSVLLTAYRKRCAISGLPEKRLLDAAHIVPDRDPELGQPVAANGLLLSKIHHAAFDQHLIGITPDYQLKVSARLLEQHDGPMLALLKELGGRSIRLPRRPQDRPDPERLALRYEQFRAAA